MYRSDVRARLRGRLDPRPTPTAGAGDRLAAVLLPLVEDDRLVLTRRTEHLSRHPGEISFPGGLAQEEDEDLAATALRVPLDGETASTARECPDSISRLTRFRSDRRSAAD